MDTRVRELLGIIVALVLTLSIVGVVGCSSDSDSDMTNTAGVEADEAEDADESGDVEDDAVEDDDSVESDISEDELRDGAEDIARAWFIGPGSDFSADQFEWNVESMVEDSEGGWWARVSATPHDSSMETEQIYVNLVPGMTIWGPVDAGTGIDPATDERFPEEIRDEL